MISSMLELPLKQPKGDFPWGFPRDFPGIPPDCTIK